MDIVSVKFITSLGGKGAFHIRRDQIKGTRENFIKEQRKYFSKSYPYLFGYGNDKGEQMLGDIWDSQHPTKKTAEKQ